MDALNIGDLVVLASGGPTMTVCDPAPAQKPGKVECKWFSKELESAFFPRAALKPPLETNDRVRQTVQAAMTDPVLHAKMIEVAEALNDIEKRI